MQLLRVLWECRVECPLSTEVRDAVMIAGNNDFAVATLDLAIACELFDKFLRGLNTCGITELSSGPLKRQSCRVLWGGGMSLEHWAMPGCGHLTRAIEC